MSFAIWETPLEIRKLQDQLQSRHAGACVTFEGWVRDHSEGRHVLRLEYEAYAVMAEQEGTAILREAEKKFEIDHAHCVHRVGSLEIGDIAVWVGVSAAHRGAAFDACRYIIDEVKHRVPIWKKEHYAEGDSGWVNCEGCAGSSR
jgi:molybdopterin synthase catalytic subunit